jgi:hypothetical protein
LLELLATSSSLALSSAQATLWPLAAAQQASRQAREAGKAASQHGIPQSQKGREAAQARLCLCSAKGQSWLPPAQRFASSAPGADVWRFFV